MKRLFNTKTILVKSIDSLLERGEKLDVLAKEYVKSGFQIPKHLSPPKKIPSKSTIEALARSLDDNFSDAEWRKK